MAVVVRYCQHLQTAGATRATREDRRRGLGGRWGSKPARVPRGCGTRIGVGGPVWTPRGGRKGALPRGLLPCIFFTLLPGLPTIFHSYTFHLTPLSLLRARGPHFIMRRPPRGHAWMGWLDAD